MPVLWHDKGMALGTFRKYKRCTNNASVVLDATAFGDSVLQEAPGDYSNDNSATGSLYLANVHNVSGCRAYEL